MLKDWNRKEQPLLGLLGSGGGIGYLAGRVTDVADLLYAISNSGVSFTLRSVGTVNYTVDWGDGSNEETSTSNTLAHTYSSSGNYKVKINSNSGTYRPKFNSSGDEDQITLVKVGVEDSSLFSNNIERAFRGAQNMTEYTQVSAATSAVSDYESTWDGCSGLTSFPLIDTSSGTKFLRAWQNCSGLTSFPLIDTSSGTNFSATWFGCSGLTSFPLIDTSSGTNFSFAWGSCSGLISFPLIDTSNGTNFSSGWRDCSGLTSFPQIDTSSGTNFATGWRNCSGITTFPLIDTSSGTDFGSTWYGCSGLTSFPLINTSSATDFGSTWRDCTGLTSFPLIDTSSGTDFNTGWRNCSAITTFPLIDTSSGTNFSFTWSGCSGLTSFPLIDTSSATSVAQAWNGCSDLVEFPALNFSSVTDSFRRTWYFNTSLTTYPANMFDNISSTPSTGFQDAFRSCALTAQSIENILTSLDTNGQQNIQLGINGGTSADASTWSTDAIIAYRNLDNKGWTISQNGTPSMSDLEYTINNSGTSFTLRSTGTVNYTVDWGDGSSLETSTSTTLAHTYSSSGTYVVKINSNSGATYRPKFNSSGDEDQITSIAIGSEDSTEFSTNIERAFRGAQNMTKYNQVGAATSSVSDFERTWQYCSGLTSFPLINTSSGTNFSKTWGECSGLTSFPLIDTSSGTNFFQTWYINSSLTSFPLIDTSSGTNFRETWQGCTGITTFPTLNTSSGTNFHETWRDCSGLISFPLIDTSSGTDFSSAWQYCSGLTSFSQLDTSSGTNFHETWEGCTGITTFPALNFSNGTDFQETWQGCTSLTTYPANQFDSTGTLASTAFNNSWNNCALTAQSIENILTSLDTNGAQNITLVISGGSNAAKSTWSTAANTAYTNLINKGWTISYNS